MWDSLTDAGAARHCCSSPNGSKRCLSPKAKPIKLLMVVNPIQYTIITISDLALQGTLINLLWLRR
jgi:hypothetical protein